MQEIAAGFLQSSGKFVPTVNAVRQEAGDSDAAKLLSYHAAHQTVRARPPNLFTRHNLRYPIPQLPAISVKTLQIAYLKAMLSDRIGYSIGIDCRINSVT